jgi:hypothetical protein
LDAREAAWATVARTYDAAHMTAEASGDSV